MEISARRSVRGRLVATGPTEHDLVVAINAKKGPTNAVRLRSILVEFYEIVGNTVLGDARLESQRKRLSDGSLLPSESKDPSGSPYLNRSSGSTHKLWARRELLAMWTSEKNRPLNLVPGEATKYEALAIVPCTGDYEIIVTIKGDRYKPIGYEATILVMYFSKRLGQAGLRGVKRAVMRLTSPSSLLQIFTSEFAWRDIETTRPAVINDVYWTASMISTASSVATNGNSNGK